jgi:hypothetical protein
MDCIALSLSLSHVDTHRQTDRHRVDDKRSYVDELPRGAHVDAHDRLHARMAGAVRREAIGDEDAVNALKLLKVGVRREQRTAELLDVAQTLDEHARPQHVGHVQRRPIALRCVVGVVHRHHHRVVVGHQRRVVPPYVAQFAARRRRRAIAGLGEALEFAVVPRRTAVDRHAEHRVVDDRIATRCVQYFGRHVAEPQRAGPLNGRECYDVRDHLSQLASSETKLSAQQM